MNQTISAPLGDANKRVEYALAALRRGLEVLVTYDEARENEGDLIFAAETLSVPQMAMLIRHCSGIVCLCVPEEKYQSLGLPMMVEHNSSRYSTAFTVSIEAAHCVITGVSAADWVRTMLVPVALLFHGYWLAEGQVEAEIFKAFEA